MSSFLRSMQMVSNYRILTIVVCSGLLLFPSEQLIAKGLGGRGGGQRANVGTPRPNVSRPNVTARPNVGTRPSMPARPNVGAPTGNFGGGMPMQRPQTSLPHLGGNSGMSKPSLNRPASPPSPRPTTKPATRPSKPGINLPDGGNLGNSGINRPTTLPGRAPLPGRNPGENLPGNGRPTGPTRPSIDRPSMPDFDRLPGGRPSGGELGDFLGINRPIAPGVGNRPGRPTTLPGNININANRPNPRPNPENRLPVNRRPSINIGDVNLGNNTVISNKPNWVNIDNNRINSINQRWQNQIGNANTLPALAPHRYDRFHNWGGNVRNNWNGRRYPGYFSPNWWTGHRFRFGGWHYFYSYSYYPYTYWWSTPTYPDLTSWFTWSAPATSWQQPAYYDYGTGGNVTYQDNSVYIGGTEISSALEFAETAATLATVPEPETEKVAEEAEWLPLGTFALTTDPDDVDPNRIVQLAVNKEGIVSGTIYNRDTEQTQAIQGRVDKETQRVAMRIGESEDIIAETGLYNLTQDEASLLVHFGSETQDSYLLVRLPSPEETSDEN